MRHSVVHSAPRMALQFNGLWLTRDIRSKSRRGLLKGDNASAALISHLEPKPICAWAIAGASDDVATF